MRGREKNRMERGQTDRRTCRFSDQLGPEGRVGEKRLNPVYFILPHSAVVTVHHTLYHHTGRSPARYLIPKSSSLPKSSSSQHCAMQVRNSGRMPPVPPGTGCSAKVAPLPVKFSKYKIPYKLAQNY